MDVMPLVVPAKRNSRQHWLHPEPIAPPTAATTRTPLWIQIQGISLQDGGLGDAGHGDAGHGDGGDSAAKMGIAIGNAP